MVERCETEGEARVKLPLWLHWIVALVGAVALAGPTAAVVWYG